MARTPRLRRSDCSAPGLHRIKRGRGFAYLDAEGERVRDTELLERARALTIPPAWSEVWICPDPLGHLQATGKDAAGRKQYLYHDRWREQRDRQKFQRMIDFALALPKLRRRVRRDIDGTQLHRGRVLACSVRMLDVGLFRVGSDEYAELDGGLGLTTIAKDHATLREATVEFDYPAKSGVRRVHAIADPDCIEIVRTLKRRRGGPAQLLAYREGRRWVGVHADDVNDYLKRSLGDKFSAKDFRTWNATVMAAVVLAGQDGRPSSRTAGKRVMGAAVREVSEMLGNTPAVARRSYIDPRVFDRFQSGWTIRSTLDDLDGFGVAGDRTRSRIEQAVVDLLDDNESSLGLRRLDGS